MQVMYYAIDLVRNYKENYEKTKNSATLMESYNIPHYMHSCSVTALFGYYVPHSVDFNNECIQKLINDRSLAIQAIG